MAHPLEFAKRAIRQRINEIFNDYERGERPALRRADALFPTDSIAWRVNGDIVTMMIGGVSGLLLQMLHPAVLAGVWDHSDFRADMHGRLRRTAKFIAVTTYDHASAGRAAIERVRSIHDRLGGVLPDGTAYRVSDPALLAWVHVTEITSFLDAWVRYGDPAMSEADQDAYIAEMARIGLALGADPVPRDRAGGQALIQSMRAGLKADARTKEVAALVMGQKIDGLAETAASKIIMRAGADLLPDWARRMHGLPAAPPAVIAGAHAMARTLSWTYDGSPNRQVWPDEITAWPQG
ncbi:oxygenase MpaB family protein [Brevundimonas sp.]|uniref:oxygenase MpaB family protein n=1 Tax=Brevundimonas sp. TaxID=1871086 RepID=UPI002ABB8EE5|nr:oxygenase MpaB family protein [Brevundimonas sp.]MDZ4364791.1 oxygenase MpaB family protein [Brevundimonas sp.]